MDAVAAIARCVRRKENDQMKSGPSCRQNVGSPDRSGGEVLAGGILLKKDQGMRHLLVFTGKGRHGSGNDENGIEKM